MKNLTFLLSDLKEGRAGFSLVEVMIAITLFGMVATSMYSIFLSMQRGTHDQEEVVDIQQSLRLGLDIMGRDIRLAGLLIPPADDNPLTFDEPILVSSTSLSINTVSSNYAYARISGDFDTSVTPARKLFREIALASYSGTNGTTDDAQNIFNVGATTEITLPIGTSEMVDRFEGGNKVVILRPQSGEQPFLKLFTSPPALVDQVQTVSGKDRTAPSLTLTGFKNLPDLLVIKPGDLIVRSPSPTTITWGLDGGNLTRDVNGVSQIIAEKIDALAFTATTDASGDVVGINVTLTAQTEAQIDKVLRQRTVTSFFKIRN